jgi:hypothetical protein
MLKSLEKIAFILLILNFTSCNLFDKKKSEIKLIPVLNGDLYQYIDNEGKIVINPQFSLATIFRDGLALVRTSGEDQKYGFISEDGKYVISPKYINATIFNENVAWVVLKNSPPTLVDNKGKTLLSLESANRVKIFKDGMAAFSIIENNIEKWGFVNKDGKIVISPQFSDVSYFSEGKCAVYNSDGKMGYIDKTGKIVINYQFNYAEEFKNGKSIVTLGDKYGVIDKTGKYIINPQYSDMKEDGDQYLISQDNKFGWCDKDGKIVINPQFKSAKPFSGNEIAPVASEKSFGYIDKDGKYIINPQFDEASSYIGKIAYVVSNDKIGFINKEGKYIINPQFDGISYDFEAYINDENVYSVVYSDFFDIKSIIDRINFNKPEGLSLTSKLSEVIDYQKRKEASINKSKKKPTKSDIVEEVDEIHVADISHEYYQFGYINHIFKERITNDALLSFYFIIEQPYIDVPDGWYTKRVINPNAIVKGYTYEISLSEKGQGKAADLIEEIEKSLNDYKKVETKTDYESISSFSNNRQTITITSYKYNDSYISISILRN